jgi:hypothetical protein
MGRKSRWEEPLADNAEGEREKNRRKRREFESTLVAQLRPALFVVRTPILRGSECNYH